MYKVVLIVLILGGFIRYEAQTESYRWAEKSIIYTDQIKVEKFNADFFPLSLVKTGYKFFISDLDGDNCPFEPTCSSFFFEALKRTNFFKASLMFSDRFLRDSNFFKTGAQYHIHNNRLYDPVENHMLNEKIMILK